jgi:hypothetical protein
VTSIRTGWTTILTDFPIQTHQWVTGLMPNALHHIWFYPPLAFARVGSGTTPLEAFHWGPNDNSPRGTGKTTIIAAETLDIDDNGFVSSRMPEQVLFKEVVDGAEVFRPVCPWYELHGRWTINNQEREGPVTSEILRACGVALEDVRWSVSVANRKAYNMTLSRGDIISAAVSLAGNDFTRRALLGTSRDAGPQEQPLVPLGRSLPFGSIQLANPVGDFPELRIRITPPVGAVYGPKGVREKIARVRKIYPDAVAHEAAEDGDRWDELQIPESRLILNDHAAWPNWVLRDGDARTVPVLQFAHIEGPREVYNSLGFVDDFSDGIITCTIKAAASAAASLQASARLVVTPPDFAPDRRHVVSISDDLKDRVARDVLAAFGDLPIHEFAPEIQDLFQRIWETMGLINLDAMNTKEDFQDPNNPGPDQAPYRPPLSSDPLPLTRHARRAHHRFAALDVLDDLFRERDARVGVGSEAGYAPPRSLMDLINAPPNADGTEAAGNSYRKMPALMRGSDGSPMHITRRQYDLLQLWISRLQQAARTS